ncbi:MAG: hypothetical protein IJX25_01655 [Clostridia bacterium]|nr:hypothetical protein [Clostridia bacterium]MBQ8792676.1 hypothetical protein [Clostridia bacterium]
MQLRPNEARDLKKSYKRLGWFLLGVLLIDAFIAFLLYSYTSIGDFLCGFIIVVITGVLYLIYLWICAKTDKKKKEKLEKSGKRDPFTRN